MQNLTHDFSATYQEGIVSAVDATKHRVRCILPALEDLETAWLPFLAPNAGGNQFYCLPDIGELVALLLDARGEGGCVLGAIYNDQDPTPVADNNIWTKTFSNGTTIMHDRSSGDLTIHTTGKIIINQSVAIEINNSPVNINNSPVTITNGAVSVSGGDTAISGGNVAMQGGNINVTGGDIVADGISLKNHVHSGVQPGGSDTAKPK